MIRKIFIAAATVALLAGTALAAVTPEEAKQLGTTLTETGAEKAGNKEGTIPPYTSGLTTPPPGFNKDKGIRPDPFANEKRLYSIDAKNMDKYADQLTEATKALMKKYPTYRVDVYQTHRTAAYPKYVIENTKKNATRAKTLNGGLEVTGAYGGVPFPIPKTGYEVMWNHLLRFTGYSVSFDRSNWNVDSAGHRTLASRSIMYEEYPYYNPAKTLETNDSDLYYMIKILFTGPPRQVGGALLIKDSVNPLKTGRKAWQYLVGQRRVKLAPELAYDTPSSTAAGMYTYDDSYVFNGGMDRYDVKLVGKKEMIVPYNNYKHFNETDIAKKLGPHHVNPDYMRWELHRVWVVEAKLKPGKRHIYLRRVFYVDEDGWGALASDQYDANGNLYRSALALGSPNYDIPAPATNDVSVYYDLIANSYSAAGQPNEGGGGKRNFPGGLPTKEWTPENLAGSGIR